MNTTKSKHDKCLICERRGSVPHAEIEVRIEGRAFYAIVCVRCAKETDVLSDFLEMAQNGLVIRL